MASRWFRVSETGSGTEADPIRPDLHGYDVEAWTGNEAHPNGPPHWIVRVYAESATLDNLAAEAGVQELSDVPVEALNNMLGQSRDANGWKKGFERN